MTTATAPAPPAAPLVIPTFVVQTVDVDVEVYRKRAAAIHADAVALVITDVEARNAAVEVLSGIARVQSEAEKKRVALVKPHNDHVTAVNRVFKDVLGPLGLADGIYRQKVLDFNRDEARRAAEAAAAAESERLKSEALLNKATVAEQQGKPDVAAQLLDQAVASETTAAAAATVAAAPVTPMRTDIGAATTTKRWTFKVDDLAKVPREYLVLDEVKVRKEIAAGVRKIDGLDIFQAEGLAVKK